jgi:protoheme IX farnesyltransferase
MARPAGLGAAAPKLTSYLALTKPRIVELLLVTTLPAMVVARGGFPPAGLVAATLVGGALAAGGANAANMYLDRDIDRVMRRTSSRPLVTGSVSPGSALAFAASLEVVAFGVLWRWANLLAAGLAAGAAAFYVVVYTMWLKRSSRQNIVIGGAAGAAPALVGWAAVTGRLALAPALMFGVVFCWTPPHFWSLALRHRDDYSAAGVPMLPCVASPAQTGQQVLGYSVATVALSLALVPVAHLGALYALVALAMGAGLLAHAAALARRPEPRRAMRLFGFSITYLSVVFAAMAADVLVRRI